MEQYRQEQLCDQTKRQDTRQTMIQVLMCGNHPTNRGGMTSVISQIREHDWEKEGVNLRFIPTYLPGNHLVKTAFFIKAYFRIRQVMKNDRPEILHVHMSYKGSFTRASYLHRLCMVTVCIYSVYCRESYELSNILYVPAFAGWVFSSYWLDQYVVRAIFLPLGRHLGRL